MMRRTGRNSRQLLWTIGLGLGMLVSACSWVPKGASQLDVGIEERGVASWYGKSFHGKQAANGDGIVPPTPSAHMPSGAAGKDSGLSHALAACGKKTSGM